MKQPLILHTFSGKAEVELITKLRARLRGLQWVNANGLKSPNTERLNEECTEQRTLDEQNLAVMQSNNDRFERLVMDKMKAFRLKLNGVNSGNVVEGDTDKVVQCDRMSVDSSSSQRGKQEIDI